ncbi:hypothetical protein BAUCODRAFT_185821 [Baudoinia panamericana UAMH 10762]|uniref:Uncharacterized protein n=1 Tax=Baudoinia panamericana (strain UAMH 10762) TaxID=717646 RepID=M2N9G2_BAUPA|nr:uncharacterized protein BAUCODRAFT_185821 [Baudoinia panamericana UAMH 10762]EMD00824.1 hypothetical protein BAUCODRAFT_185821 [Baudoinia panamericana UAMH 10762]
MFAILGHRPKLWTDNDVLNTEKEGRWFSRKNQARCILHIVLALQCSIIGFVASLACGSLSHRHACFHERRNARLHYMLPSCHLGNDAHLALGLAAIGGLSAAFLCCCKHAFTCSAGFRWSTPRWDQLLLSGDATMNETFVPVCLV